MRPISVPHEYSQQSEESGQTQLKQELPHSAARNQPIAIPVQRRAAQRLFLVPVAESQPQTLAQTGVTTVAAVAPSTKGTASLTAPAAHMPQADQTSQEVGQASSAALTAVNDGSQASVSAQPTSLEAATLQATAEEAPEKTKSDTSK